MSTLPTTPRRHVTAIGRGFEPLVAEIDEWDVGALLRGQARNSLKAIARPALR
jgi:hypothetical protein